MHETTFLIYNIIYVMEYLCAKSGSLCKILVLIANNQNHLDSIQNLLFVQLYHGLIQVGT